MLAAARRGLRLGHTDANTHTVYTQCTISPKTVHTVHTGVSSSNTHTTPRLSSLLCQRKQWTVDHSKGDGQLSIAKQGSERESLFNQTRMAEYYAQALISYGQLKSPKMVYNHKNG